MDSTTLDGKERLGHLREVFPPMFVGVQSIGLDSSYDKLTKKG